MASIEDESETTSIERATAPNTGVEDNTPVKSSAETASDATNSTVAQHTQPVVHNVVNTAANSASEPVVQGIGSHPLQSNVENLGVTPAPLVTDNETRQLLKDILQTLKSSTIAQETGIDNRSRLWATYRREAKEFDDEFLEKYGDDMDIVLIFAGLFSAVSTTFITSMQSNLSPDPTATTNVLLMQLVQVANASAFAGQDLGLPSWNGPGSTVIWTQSLIYASLSASLLAALGAVLGKQWLAHYRQSKFGTSEQRALHRQAKSDALERWKFQAMLGVLPVLLQISLLLFGIALSAYVWTQQSTIAAVVTGATAIGVVFYTLITLASAFSHDCPFRTPLANPIKFLWQDVLFRQAVKSFMKRYWGGVQICCNWISGLPSFCFNAVLSSSPRPVRILLVVGFLKFRDGFFWCCARMQRFFCYRKHRILSNPDLKFREHEAPAIRWLLDISTDQEVLLTAAQVVPDIEWPVEVDVLEIYAQVGNAFKGCFVPVPGGTGLALAPFAHDRAFVFGKALLHLFCNRLCLSKAQDEIPLGDRDFNLSLLNSFECLAKFGKDNSTSLIRAMASMLFGGNLFHQGGFSRVPQSDLTWILRLLPHLLAHPDCSIEVQRLAVSEIVELLRFPTPHQQTLADCSLSVAIMLGVPVDRKYMVRVDSSSLVDTLLEKFLQQPASVRDLAAKQQEILLLALATLLEKCQIYPKLGTCGSKACLCDTIDSVTMIFTSCVTRALQLVTAAAPATETETEAALLEHARAALHLGAILTVIPRHDDHTLNRWNPTYCGHPFRFLIDRPESVVYFLNHHYNSREDAAVADTLFMLSQSRDVEQWANSSFFIHEIIRAMNHQSEHVRHSTLQVVRRMRHALASSETAKSPILTSLRSIIPSIQGEDNKGQVLCCLQIIHTFVLYHHHDPTWVADFLQKHSDRWLRPKYTCVRAYSVYLLAILAIVEHHNIKCAFRSLFDYKLRSTHLFGAWLALEPPVAHEFNGDILDEVLPNLIAFTIKYQSYGSARSWIFDKPETLLDDLQKNRPESSSIPLLQEMISSLPPIER